MGRRGPKPTPTETLKRRGSWRAGTRPREPQFRMGQPSMPGGLSVAAQEHWRFLVGELDAAGILALVDRDALEVYVREWDLLQSIVAQIGAEGFVVKSKRGMQRTNPIVNLFFQLSADLDKRHAAFGMTPATRARIEVPGQPDDDSGDGLFGGPGKPPKLLALPGKKRGRPRKAKPTDGPPAAQGDDAPGEPADDGQN